MVKQHDAQGANHLTQVIAQRDTTHNKRASPVGEQINQDGLAGFQHVVHLGVLHHAGHGVAHKILYPIKTQRW